MLDRHLDREPGPAMRELPKIDPHHHLWDLDRNYYPWLIDGVPRQRVYGDSAPLRRNYRIEDYQTDIAHQNVVKSVHLQCGWDPRDHVGETRWVQAVADAHPQGFPHGIVGHADLEADDVDTVLRGHCQYPNMRGIRVLLCWHEVPEYRWAQRGDLMDDPAWLRGYRLLARHGLSFDAMCYDHQLAALAAVARANPDVPVILNHTGMPLGRTPADVARWRAGMEELALCPHASVKISGLGMVDHHWTVDSIRPYVIDTIRIFGVERCMFASNFPVDSLKSDLDTLFDSFATIVADFPIADRRKLFHDNAARIYRL
jgi:predicted TIM-barrel fold metal-dependent hydrolase